jgi:hypothetical protein
MASQARIHHKVKFGPPSKNENEVKQYMTDENVNREIPGGLKPSFLDETQKINVELLQIISKGINDIVDKLKFRLGNNFDESNKNAGIIRERLDILKRDIIEAIDFNDNSIYKDVAIQIDKTPGNNYSPIIGQNYLSGIKNPDGTTIDGLTNITVADIDINPNYNFQDLDTNYQNVIENQNVLYDTEMEYNRIEVEKRLKNCQNLEFLYLKKHDEIMKIFSFTLNLFDKYKYSINVMLFLLKHLVYKETDPNNPPPPYTKQFIKMPRTIIKNIKKLLQDQKQVQDVIDRMKTVIVDDAADVNSPEAKLQRATSDKNIADANPVVKEKDIKEKIPKLTNLNRFDSQNRLIPDINPIPREGLNPPLQP